MESSRPGASGRTGLSGQPWMNDQMKLNHIMGFSSPCPGARPAALETDSDRQDGEAEVVW